ncbi:MAG TPA: hypothetical protein EYM39_06515 [Candidatus Latescibacteria bacterium]|nr:hypothetical protein [Candidatus Latescibacterota bacterium]HIM56339.1 hypothetical protein [Candidatus Latescibacterota bacterium]
MTPDLVEGVVAIKDDFCGKFNSAGITKHVAGGRWRLHRHRRTDEIRETEMTTYSCVLLPEPACETL